MVKIKFQTGHTGYIVNGHKQKEGCAYQGVEHPTPYTHMLVCSCGEKDRVALLPPFTLSTGWTAGAPRTALFIDPESLSSR
jgi:hypothetical protein